MTHDHKVPQMHKAGRMIRMLGLSTALLAATAPIHAQYSPIDHILKQGSTKSPVNNYANAPTAYGYNDQRASSYHDDSDPRYDRPAYDRQAYDNTGRSLRQETVHIVEPGETLNGVAERADVSARLLAEANRIPSPYYLYVGQRLIIPRTRTHVVQPGETGFDLAYRYGISYSEIAVANNLSPDSYLRVGQVLRIPTVTQPTPRPAPPARPQNLLGNGGAASQRVAARFAWPVDGRVRRRFTARSRAPGGGNYHDGIDIIANEGVAVRAITAGTVTFAGREPDSYGNTVVVQHDGGWVSVYSFLSRITVRAGDRVTPRERVGLVGHTGRATRDELHFELRRNRSLVDPLNYLPPRDLNAPNYYNDGY